MTPPPLNDACLAILLACELLGAAAQTVHLPLLLARRGGAEGRLGAAFELLVAAHLYMAVDFTCCCAFVGNPYLAPVALGAGWSWRLWANAAAFACGAALAVRKKDPLDLMAAALLALCTPPAMEALGGVWNLVALVDAPFFLARALLALVGDVQRHKSELTRFSIAETMNTVPVGALVVDAGGNRAAQDVVHALADAPLGALAACGGVFVPAVGQVTRHIRDREGDELAVVEGLDDVHVAVGHL